MKKSKIALSILLVLSTNSIYAASESNLHSRMGNEFLNIIDNRKDPIAFRPYEISDLKDPRTGKVIDQWQPLIIERDGQPIFLTPQEILKNLNTVEKTLNKYGISLKDDNPLILIQSIMDPDYMIRIVRQKFGAELQTLATEFLPPLSECPSISLNDLGNNPATGKNWSEKDKIQISSSRSVEVSSFLPKLNEQQKYFCELGFSLLENTVPGSEHFVQNLLDNRNELMKKFKFDETHPLFQMAKWVEEMDFAKMQIELKEIEDAIKNPSVPKILNLAEKYKDVIPEELRLPDIPSNPSPVLEKRTDLKLKKYIPWTGINIGNQDLIKIYANAWLELRAGRIDEPQNAPTTDHALQAEAKAGAWFLKNEYNVAYASLNSELSPKNASSYFKYCFLIHCDTDFVGKNGIGISASKPDLFVKNDVWRNSYPFMIGPIPATVNYGATLSASLGYSVGLNLMLAEAKIIGKAKASAIAEGAIGVEGVATAGVGGEIMILSEELSGGAEAKFQFVGNKPTLSAAIVADNTISAFDGRLYGFARVDLLDAPIKLVEDILKALEKTPGFKDLAKNLNAAGAKLSNEAKKVVDTFVSFVENPGGSIEGAVRKVEEWVAPSCKRCRWGFEIAGTSVNYEEDIVKWTPHKDSSRIINFKMYVGPDGKEYGGDAKDFQSEELFNLQLANLNYQQRLNEVATLEQNFKNRKKLIFEKIQQHLTSSISTSTTTQASLIQAEMDLLEKRRSNVASLLTGY